MAQYQTPFMGQFIQSSIGNVADPLIAGLKEKQKANVLSNLPKGQDGKFDYNAAIDYLIRNNQTDVAAKLAPIVTAQQQQSGMHGTPIYGQGPNGETLLFGMTKAGGVQSLPLPGGATPTLPVKAIDTGTGTQIIPNRMPFGGGQPTMPPNTQPTARSGPPTGFAPPAPPLDVNSEGIPPSQAARVNAPQAGSAAPIQPTPVPTQSIRPGFIPRDTEGREADEARGQARGKAQANYPQIVASAGSSLRLIDAAIKHPGRGTATGLSSALDPRNYIRGTNARDFQVRAKQLEGRVFLDAFDQLRGGGAITESEGNKATAAHARLDRAQSDDEYLAALKELQGILIKGVKVARLKAQGRWADADRELGQNIPDVTVTTPGAPSIDDLVKKYSK